MFEVERVLFKTSDDPKIREITTRMSRFHLNMEFEEERMEEKAYIIESEIPLVFTRFTPDKVEAIKNVFVITEPEKNGSKIYITPGVIALVMFIHKRIDIGKVKEAQLFLYDFFVSQIKGAYVNGNDLLINHKKVMGLSFIYNDVSKTAAVHFMLTMKAEQLNRMVKEEDFYDKKYTGVTGVCDETGLTEFDVREMVADFANMVLDWRDK